VSGGTTILKMADLTKVRVRALVNETDIGKVRPGLPAQVTVDAFPDRPFIGTVEKIEPQATIQQSVTMFPVLISIDNIARLLMPGMNGEVSIEVERRENVLAIPNDAVRSMNEVAAVAPLLGLDPDSVRAELRNQGGGRNKDASRDRKDGGIRKRAPKAGPGSDFEVAVEPNGMESRISRCEGTSHALRIKRETNTNRGKADERQGGKPSGHRPPFAEDGDRKQAKPGGHATGQ